MDQQKSETQDTVGKHAVEFDLRQLEVFSKVVELGSISRAAQAVGLAQASVSERMSNLETSIGTQLLDRIGRQIKPTRAGQLLYEQALKHLGLKRATQQLMEEYLGVKRGELLLGGSTIPGEYILPGVIAGFRRGHQNVTVRLAVADSGNVVEMVLGGAVELGIVGYRETHRYLEYTQAWPDELVLVVPPGHPWAGAQAVTVEQLASEPFIQRESGSGTRAQLQNELESICGYGCERFNVVAQLGSSTAVKEAIGQGLGLSILSRHAVARELAGGTLAAVRLEGAEFKRSFWLVEDRRRSLSPLAEGFKQYILQT